MSTRARYTGQALVIRINDRPVMPGEVVGDEYADITASEETVRDLLARGDFEPVADTGQPTDKTPPAAKPRKAKAKE